ncbi:hypothetical protein, variant 1 [Capsaspora owczarzaki ATCC 30864]|uniref:Guanylyl cyclase n=1 Tax=Capsaspora owczarzaki (strain ATCC 30864) TaxID=595528 RepID=A0A0D2VN39_CAPO3|nr:hypothetical protein, variant 1 [Capsaspora owczarzaki ATCC 30864]
MAGHVDHSNVYHVRQRSHWDCGIACAAMVLRWLYDTWHHASLASRAGAVDAPLSSPCTVPGPTQVLLRLHDALEFLGIGTSVWTIDLFRLLNHILRSSNTASLPDLASCVSFTTRTLGIDPAHGKEPFYEVALTSDHDRIAASFASCQQSENVAKRTLLLDDLVGLLDAGGIAIVLVDARGLHCVECHSGAACNNISLNFLSRSRHGSMTGASESTSSDTSRPRSLSSGVLACASSSDHNVLNAAQLGADKANTSYEREFCELASAPLDLERDVGYAGHYVVLRGYSRPATGPMLFYVNDPGRDHRECSNFCSLLHIGFFRPLQLCRLD